MTRKAPERIWTASTNGNCHVGFDTPSMNYTNEYVRADLAQAPAPVRVKPLVWEVDTDKRDGRTHYGYGVFGHWYAVFREKTGAWGVFHFVSGKRTSLHPADSDTYPTLEAAKAAAQADYEARIIAALEAPEAGVVAELVEALRLADAALSGANMNMAVVEKKVKAALALIAHNTTEG